jgi:hypothetical protein
LVVLQRRLFATCYFKTAGRINSYGIAWFDRAGSTWIAGVSLSN